MDIAVGPATNAIEMIKRDIQLTAIDFSKEMVSYGMKKALENNVALNYLQADMRDFKLLKRVDLAAIFMASTGYLLTNEDMIEHLKSVGSNLNPNGVYVLEMIHPRDVFSVNYVGGERWRR